MSTQKTTIQLEPETRERLFNEKTGPKETYDDVVNRLLDNTE